MLIKLHEAPDFPIWVNPYQIVSITDFRKVNGLDGYFSSVVLTKGKFQVMETVEEILEIINHTNLLTTLFNQETL